MSARALQPRDWLLLLVAALALFLPGWASLPPTDRDESRYVVTSERMADTGDIVDLRFQDVPRYLQPAGIYWMQAAATTIFDSPAHDSVWPYRIPSLLGALLAVLLTGLAGARLLGREAGIAAALMLAACFSLNFEARIAKIDAALLAAITAAQLALLSAYHDPKAVSRGKAAVFWAALGVGLMLKGPVILVVTGTTILALAIWDRGAAWLKALRPAWGPLVTLAIAAPWFIAIGIMTDGEFYERALVRNFVSKIGDSEQGHRGPPGYHLALFVLAFWPASLLAFRAVGYAWRERATPLVRFLLCWIAPTWVVFEFVATKLPHYVLPTYPAIALLASAALFDPKVAALASASKWRGVLFGFATALWLVISAVVAAAAPVVLWQLGNVVSVAAIALGVITLTAIAYSLWLTWKRDWVKAVGAMTVGAALAWTNLYMIAAPQLDGLWLSPRIAAAARAARTCDDAVLVTAPYNEPSLIFLYGRDRTKLATTGEEAAEAFATNARCGIALVGAAERDAFLARAGALGLHPDAMGRIDGRNYSNNDTLELTFYTASTAP